MSDIKISVVIPTFKRPELLLRLLESVSCQTRLPEQVIIVDDCSGMVEEYEKVISRFRDSFPELIYVVQECNSGAPAARNLGLALATGNWVALVDDDDEWMPEKLQRQAQLIQETKFSNLGLVYTWTKAEGSGALSSYISSKSVRGEASSALLTTNFIMSASVIVRRDAIMAAGLFDLQLPSCQDWDMWLRISLAGYEIDVVEEVLTIYHRHGGESIGLSPRAKLGYKLFLDKHFKSMIRHTSPLNVFKKSWLYVSSWAATYGKA